MLIKMCDPHVVWLITETRGVISVLVLFCPVTKMGDKMLHLELLNFYCCVICPPLEGHCYN